MSEERRKKQEDRSGSGSGKPKSKKTFVYGVLLILFAGLLLDAALK